MKLEEIYVKVQEVYLVARKMGLSDLQISLLDIMEANYVSKKVENVNFKLLMATERGTNGRFILIQRLQSFSPMKLVDLVTCFNDIRANGNAALFKDEMIGKWKICEHSQDKTKLDEITMDLELVRVEGEKTYFVQKTEIYKSGLLKIVN